jgi:hypothetical protein
MSLTSTSFPLPIVISFMFLLSCNTTKHNKSGVESAMKYYDHLILKLDADSISMLYAPDGNLGGIAIGRDSIRKFLSSFKNVRVLSQSSTTGSINIIRDTAIQKGTYTQIDIVSGKDTVRVKGEYTTRWEWIHKEGWHIKQMTTKSTN